MKILKWLLIVVLILAALILIIPLFMPSTLSVGSSVETSLSPAQVFHAAASFADQGSWDPWLATEPGVEWTVEAQKDYIGTKYSWNGKKIGSGQQVVDSLVFGKYIASTIHFGNDPKGSLVEWIIDKTETGTKATWSFTTVTGYPIERLMMNLMKGKLQADFEKGLANFKEHFEANPPVLSSLSEFEFSTIAPMFALVVRSEGTMDQYATQMDASFGMLMKAMQSQGLQSAGAPFCQYLTFDEETGITTFLTGIPVNSKGKDEEGVMAKKYPEIKVIQAMHTGPYEELMASYQKFMEHIAANQIETTQEAFEFYFTDPTMEPNVTKWQTLIAFPLK
jgi:effector-binding domain-containing protein